MLRRLQRAGSGPRPSHVPRSGVTSPLAPTVGGSARSCAPEPRSGLRSQTRSSSPFPTSHCTRCQSGDGLATPPSSHPSETRSPRDRRHAGRIGATPADAWPATEAGIRLVVLQDHAGFLYRHRIAGRTHVENPYKGSVPGGSPAPRISAERAGVEVRGRPNATRRGRGDTRSTPGGTGLRGIRTHSGRTNRGGTAACPDGRSPRREGLASKRSCGADTAHTASVPRRRGASAKAFDRIVTARRTRPSATCALAGNGRMAERRSHWSPPRVPATPRVTRHR